MYTPAHFRMDDSGQILEFVQAHPFGLLLTNGPEVPEVTHLPLLLQADDSGDDHILGHVAKANPHAKALVDGQAARVVFSGAHGYISPRWYAADGNVPTWNYRSVHATGALRRIADEGELMQLVDTLAAEHEASSRVGGAYEPPPCWVTRSLTVGPCGFSPTAPRSTPESGSSPLSVRSMT